MTRARAGELAGHVPSAAMGDGSEEDASDLRLGGYAVGKTAEPRQMNNLNLVMKSRTTPTRLTLELIVRLRTIPGGKLSRSGAGCKLQRRLEPV